MKQPIFLLLLILCISSCKTLKSLKTHTKNNIHHSTDSTSRKDSAFARETNIIEWVNDTAHIGSDSLEGFVNPIEGDPDTVQSDDIVTVVTKVVGRPGIIVKTVTKPKNIPVQGFKQTTTKETAQGSITTDLKKMDVDKSKITTKQKEVKTVPFGFYVVGGVIILIILFVGAVYVKKRFLT